MKPGRGLDIVIAEKVLDWIPEHEDNGHAFGFSGHDTFSREYPFYSTNLADAFDATKEVALDAIQISYHSHDEPVSVTLALTDGRQVYADGVSEAHAICLALLKVKEKK